MISPKNSKLPANGRLQTLQDPANGPLIACLQQLCDLPRAAFALINGWVFHARFIKELKNIVQEHSLRLEIVYIRRSWRETHWLGRYTKQIDSRSDLVSWEVEYHIRDKLEFVDRW